MIMRSNRDTCPELLSKWDLQKYLLILNFSINMRYVIGVQTGVLDMVRVHVGKQRNHWLLRLTLSWTSTRPATRARASRGRSRGWRSTPTSTKRPWRTTWQWSPWEPLSLWPLAELHQSEQSCKIGMPFAKIRNFQYFSLWQCGWVWIYDFGQTFGWNNEGLISFFSFQEPNSCNLFFPSSS